jgi:hypothetical protein
MIAQREIYVRGFSKCSLEQLNLFHVIVGIELDRDNIEAIRRRNRALAAEIMLRGANDALLFPSVHRFFRFAEPIAGAALYLNKGNCAAIFRDYVYFTLPSREIPGKNPITAFLQEPLGLRFAQAPEAFLVQRAHSAMPALFRVPQ